MSDQLATFHLADHLFAVPVFQVQEVLMEQPHTPAPGAAPAVAGLINLRGQVVTALDLRTRLCLPERTTHNGETPSSINVVVRAGEEVWSLIVDRIGDVIDVETEQFEPPPDTLTGPLRELIIGAYKLDHQLLLLLDVTRVLDLSPSAAA
jgi:purine-binding chemotaxis protein CheW